MTSAADKIAAIMADTTDRGTPLPDIGSQIEIRLNDETERLAIVAKADDGADYAGTADDLRYVTADGEQLQPSRHVTYRRYRSPKSNPVMTPALRDAIQAIANDKQTCDARSRAREIVANPGVNQKMTPMKEGFIQCLRQRMPLSPNPAAAGLEAAWGKANSASTTSR